MTPAVGKPAVGKITIPLHHGTDPSNVRCELDVPNATFVITGTDGQVLASRQTTALQAYFFASRLMAAVLDAAPTSAAPESSPPGSAPARPACDLCGRPATRDDSAEWKMPRGTNGIVHHACIIELIECRRRERHTEQAELFGMGGGK